MLINRSRGKMTYLVVPLLISFFLLGSFINGGNALTVEEEKKLGKKILAEMEKKIEFVRDLNIQTFLDQMGQSFVSQIGPTPFEFKFYLINARDPNAFAIPGGYIFFTTGLIVLAENEQEVAGVMSHEMAHITQRHVAQMIERSKRLSIATMAAVVAAMLAGGGGKGSQAAAMTAMATAEALALKYTREMEVDADQNSFHYMMKTGHDPNGMMTFLHKIYRTSLISAPTLPPYLSTHPAIENRISLLENLLQMKPKPIGPFRTVGNFKRIQIKTLVAEREPDATLAHFQSLIDADPHDIDGYYGLGLAYRKSGRLDKSLEALQFAHSKAPDDPDLSRELGIVYFLSGRGGQAIKILEAITSSPKMNQNDDLLALYYLGRGYQENGAFEQALPLLLKVRKEKPEFVEVYYPLGSIYGRIGQKGLSHFYFGKYFKLRGERSNALLHFRKAYESLDRGSLERGDAQREIKELMES